MEAYRKYWVVTARSRPGKSAEAAKWWRETGKACFEATPGVKSVRAYGCQFGLGGEFGLEIWQEIENYAIFDRIDEDMISGNADTYAWLVQWRELFEDGPARLMGEWPESQFAPPVQE
jgi:hypothetical protein